MKQINPLMFSKGNIAEEKMGATATPRILSLPKLCYPPIGWFVKPDTSYTTYKYLSNNFKAQFQLAPFAFCLETGVLLFEAWFDEIVEDPSIFVINIKRATPMLETLPNAQNPKPFSLNSLEKLDSIYNILGFFIGDMVEDKLLTNQTLQAIKAAAEQVWTFRQCSFKCLKLTNIQENH